MEKIKNCTGISKFLFNIKINIYVFFHYLGKLIKGDVSIRKFLIILQRLIYFLAKLQHNKFVRIGKNTRLNLYIPGFPAKSFYTALNKFSIFDDKLPNTTVLISLTSACRYSCSHCYQRNDKGKDLPLEHLSLLIKTFHNTSMRPGTGETIRNFIRFLKKITKWVSSFLFYDYI
ncbi:MAG: hypothetical protein JXJ04_03565 [Spirochaetales bacterium]|nr:hypothetical protein [Spirochaetales bacterium]